MDFLGNFEENLGLNFKEWQVFMLYVQHRCTATFLADAAVNDLEFGRNLLVNKRYLPSIKVLLLHCLRNS